jgi:APA family basic amino acid/polyamine antiporter
MSEPEPHQASRETNESGAAPIGGPAALPRVVGLPGAVLMGLGSMVGTGVFVSIGFGAEVAGPAVVLAIALAALIATLNGLSSAQLAASHPVSGGTYEYGYRYLTPQLGFVAGWTFLCAKTASAATAALGLAGYVLSALGITAAIWHMLLALGAVFVVTRLVLSGIRRSNAANTAIVGITLFALLLFVISALPAAVGSGRAHFVPFFAPVDPGGVGQAGPPGESPVKGVLHATALLFVAFTGYGRIATLGEEVREPRRTIPRAILLALLASMVLYIAVGAVGIGSVGASRFAAATREAGAPLESIAYALDLPAARWVLAIGAVTAMLGVLLNLILGISRVLLAMGRRGDMPASFAALDREGTTPTTAVILTGMAIAALVLLGNLRAIWSFSAFTVLVYYAVTNLAALRLPPGERRYPRVIAAIGLLGCLFLAFWVERSVWASGLAITGVGLIWHAIARRAGRSMRKL